jgi:hypothetical protein
MLLGYRVAFGQEKHIKRVFFTKKELSYEEELYIKSTVNSVFHVGY